MVGGRMNAGSYAQWAKTYANAVSAAADKTAERRRTHPRVGAYQAHRRENHPCGIKGCKFVTYKGELCRKHWMMIPERDRAEAAVASVTAAWETARKYHRRFLRQVRAMQPAGER